MWNRRKEDEVVPRSPSQLPTAADLSRDGVPMSTLSPKVEPSNGSGRAAAIGKAVVVKGEIQSREDLYVDGEVEGAIDMPDSKLTIGPSGRVKAGVKARELVVVGTIHGNVDVLDKTEIRKDAKLVGDIRTVRITIEDGAYFKGSIDIVRPDAKAEAKGKPASSVAAPTPVAAESKA
jgi:cytoskeletal protein CcmA (bactofilin family)